MIDKIDNYVLHYFPFYFVFQLHTSFYTGITTAHIVASYVVALLVTDLGKVFAVIGATGSTTVCYLLPGLFYSRLFPMRR